MVRIHIVQAPDCLYACRGSVRAIVDVDTPRDTNQSPASYVARRVYDGMSCCI